MNLSYLKYAVAVERAGSITRAARQLYMNQPHLSKIIRELEQELGTPIFRRTGRGMTPTPKGEEFLRYARAVMVQERQLEALCQENTEASLTVSLCAPHSFGLARGFASFMKELTHYSSIQVRFLETASRNIVNFISDKTFDLGIIRCQADSFPYYERVLKTENLDFQLLWEFSCQLLVSAGSQLAQWEGLTQKDLENFILVCSEPEPGSPFSRDSDSPSVHSASQSRTISVSDRAAQIEILRQVPDSYLWSPALPDDLLKSQGLVLVPCDCLENPFQDLLIFRKGYRLSREEQQLIDCLRRTLGDLM